MLTIFSTTKTRVTMNNQTEGQQPQPSQEWQELQAKFMALCDEQESIYKPQFEAIFAALFEIDEGQRAIYNTNGWNMRQPLPDKADEGIIAQAIKKAGFAKKTNIADGFLRYANIVIEGKQLRQKMALQNLTEIEPPQPPLVAGWVFKPMACIAAPVEFHNTIIEAVYNAALKGLFDSKTDTPNVDELLDELMMAEAFNVRCSLTHYTEELRRYNIIQGDGSFFDRDCTRLLLATLKEAVQALKEHSDQPNTLKKDIADILKRFDDVKVWGIFFQILVLQGLVDLLERLDINEGDTGFDEAQAFLNWTFEILIEKEYCFTCVNSIAYGDGDFQRLQPLCEYLMTTTAGKAVQEYINQPQQNSDTAATGGDTTPQPLTRHYNSTYTEEQLTRVFNALTNGGFLPADSDLQGWLWVCTGKGKKAATEPLKLNMTQTELALFVGDLFGTKEWATTVVCCRYNDNGNWKQPKNGYLAKQYGKHNPKGKKALQGTKLGDILLPIIK